jgi:hypothetical protein
MNDPSTRPISLDRYRAQDIAWLRMICFQKSIKLPTDAEADEFADTVQELLGDVIASEHTARLTALTELEKARQEKHSSSLLAPAQ